MTKFDSSDHLVSALFIFTDIRHGKLFKKKNHFDLTYLKILYFFFSILFLKDTYTHTHENEEKKAEERYFLKRVLPSCNALFVKSVVLITSTMV